MKFFSYNWMNMEDNAVIKVIWYDSWLSYHSSQHFQVNQIHPCLIAGLDNYY